MISDCFATLNSLLENINQHEHYHHHADVELKPRVGALKDRGDKW